MKALLRLCLLCLSPLLACSPQPAQDDGGPARDAGADVDVDAGPLASLAVLDEIADFALLASDEGTVKYLAPVAGVEPREPLGDECAFQDTARYPYHLPFLTTLDGGEDLTFNDYIALVLQRQTRVWWGGEVSWRESQEHPLSGEPGVLLYSLYTEDSPGNRLVIDDVRSVHTTLRACAPAFADALAFEPTSNEQRATAQQIAGTLADEGIAVIVSP